MPTAYRNLRSRYVARAFHTPEGGSGYGGDEIIPTFNDIDTKNASVFIIAEESIDLDYYRSLLDESGYAVAGAEHPDSAIFTVNQSVPDVIVIDIDSPSRCNEVCSRITFSTAHPSLPILISSEIPEGDYRLQALQNGVFDFFSKPVDQSEFLLRVRNAARTKILTEQAGQSRKLERIEELRDSLTHMLVHDLRQPVQALNLSLELLKLQVSGDEEKSLVNSSLGVVKRIITMLQSLLDVNKLEEGKVELQKESISLSNLTDAVVKELDPLLAEHTVEIESYTDDAIIEGDTELVRRAITNLLVNAAENTPHEGSIRISIHSTSHSATIVVTDTGRGIPTEFREKIFEKFGQVTRDDLTKKQSPGLGLPFCKLVAEAHKGEIGVDSTPGKGSSFWMSFPLNDQAFPELSP